MEALQFWLQGLAVALSPENLLFAFVGCVLGTLIGVLPGLGPAAGTAILVPVTFGLDPIPAIIMLSAIYYGAMYGGTITAVLVNVPGEAASVVTCIDGHEMARQGRAGAALGIAAIGSFLGGTAGTLLLMVVALPLAGLALRFGAPETFALLLVGLSLVTGLAGRSLLAALLMTCFGLVLAMVGMDPARGAPRFTFGLVELYDGIGFVPAVMGLFGVGEILRAAEVPAREVLRTRLSAFLPPRDEWGGSLAAIGRGTFLGFALGLIPGIGAIVPTFLSYMVEKRASRHPERFGTGAIEAVAGPETANNAYATGSMVPLLALGIPGSPTLAVLMGAFVVNGIAPGPFLFQSRPELVWGVIASFYVGNLVLLALNLPLVGLWARILEVRRHYLYPGILLFCVVGAYSLRQSTFDVGLMIGFGALGYVLRKLDWPLAPAMLALVLGPMLERSLRTSLEMSNGDPWIFVERPAALALLTLTGLIVAFSAFRLILLRRAAAIVGEVAPPPSRA